VVTAPTEGRLHAGTDGAEVAHSIPQKAAPVNSRRGRLFVPCVLPERSTDGFHRFRGPGVPPEFLRPPAIPPGRLLPSLHHPSPVFPGGGPPAAPDSLKIQRAAHRQTAALENVGELLVKGGGGIARILLFRWMMS